MVVEYKGKRYPVIGEGDTYYICTEPWQEVEGISFRVPKDQAKVFVIHGKS